MNHDDDILGSLFGHPFPGASRPTPPKPEARPLPQIHGRRMDGVLWVRAEDVADALESQAPKVNARLIRKLRA